MTKDEWFLNISSGGFKNAKDAREAYSSIERKLNQTEKSDAIILLSAWEAEEDRTHERERHVLFDIVPHGWFQHYLEYCRASESPLMFHLACSLAVFSHLVGKRRYFFLHGRNIYAPVSVFLVSPAGHARRGEAIEPAVRIATDAGAKILQDQATMEGLIEYFKTNSKALLVAEEAAVLFSGKDYVKDLPQTLCKLLDCSKNPFGRLLKSGQVKTKQATVNVIFSSAPAWFATMPQTAIGGGMMSRLVTFYEGKKERSLPFPQDVVRSSLLKKKEKKLIEELKEIVSEFERGEITYKGKSKKLFKRFYKENDAALENSSDTMSHWFARKPAHAHRLAMNFQIAQGLGLEITDDSLERSLAILRIAEEKLEQVYRHTSQSVHEQKRQKIVDTIARSGDHGAMEHSRLLQNVGHNFKNALEMGDYIDSLIEMKVIREEKRKTKGRPIRVYHLIRMEDVI